MRIQETLRQWPWARLRLIDYYNTLYDTTLISVILMHYNMLALGVYILIHKYGIFTNIAQTRRIWFGRIRHSPDWVRADRPLSYSDFQLIPSRGTRFPTEVCFSVDNQVVDDLWILYSGTSLDMTSNHDWYNSRKTLQEPMNVVGNHA